MDKKSLDKMFDQFLKQSFDQIEKRINTLISNMNYFLPISLGMAYFAWRVEIKLYSIMFIIGALFTLIVLMYLRHSLVEISRINNVYNLNLPINYDFSGKKNFEIILSKLDIESDFLKKYMNRNETASKINQNHRNCQIFYYLFQGFFSFLLGSFLISLISMI